MSERDIFTAAHEITDPVARAAYLDGACGGDTGLRARVETLLRAHDQPDSLLDHPMVAPSSPDSATTCATGLESSAGADDVPLRFLEPATRSDALGRIGHYEVLQVLGQGGFGIVFRAFDVELHRVVAVKVLSPQMAATSPARKRFLREARSSAQVRHENVVQVYEVGEQPLPYIAMEFIPGETLQQRLDRVGPVEPAEVVRVGRQVAEGLAAAHATDLIHRDIKPGNILLEGGAQRVKITDFGLARAADDASISQSGIIAGTPMYMAPEQARGEKLDQRADLFSLGSVLYQMAAGRPPFRATGTLAVLNRVAEDTPRDIREIIPETPQWLCDIIAKLHAKNPGDRFQSAREVADVLADCEAQLKENARLKDSSRIPRTRQPAAGKPGRWKWVAAAVLLLPVIALAVTEFGGVTHLFQEQATPAPGKPGSDSSLAVKKELSPQQNGFVPLFNGMDLSGWQAHPAASAAAWRVENSILVGTGEVSYLFHPAAEYDNFHLLAEFQVNNTGNGGIYFRSPFPKADEGPHAKGYEAQIIGPDAPFSHYMTGSLINFTTSKGTRIDADTWYTLEVIADGPRLQVKLNSVTMTDVRDEKNQFTRGHVALQLWEPGTAVRFRKIEIKETVRMDPPAAPPLSTFKNSSGLEFVLVPKGKSWLGGSKDRLDDQEVEIPAVFHLGKYEVMREEWEKVMGENPSHFSRMGGGADAVKDIADVDLKWFPVENVSWDQCQVFVAKLNKLAKQSGWICRSPTEVSGNNGESTGSRKSPPVQPEPWMS